ncbi:MAG TPA: aspartate/glutamate racemase family protein [Syntrophales bacterium]|nr:aspartate/glutamate racemase family protein [Syntrophales bacterium]HPQ42639.1 aspartate/glutamate racemase family protein [Syntrophales bacterium]
MTTVVKGGKNVYGQAIGIIMLEARFPRIPGDIGNATTWDFPVVYEIVRGISPSMVVRREGFAGLQNFIDAARNLEADGVRAITTSCGFLAPFQKELSNSVSIPVFTSSLMQVPLVYPMLKKGQKVGIITINAEALTEDHLAGAGADRIPTVIYGMEGYPEFTPTIVGDGETLNMRHMQDEMIACGRHMLEDHPEVGAIVLECTNMPPYAAGLQEATGLPVFDIYTLTTLVYHAVARWEFRGFM